MWHLPSAPENEAERLAALDACGIMDTPRDERFDRLARLAQRFYKADAAFVSFIDDQFQWMKSVTSTEIAPSIERNRSVCQHIVSTGQPLVVPDLKTSPAFDGHPVVPLLSLRFYAGVPIKIEPDLVIGSLCVLSRDAATDDELDLEPLQDIAAVVVDEIEMRRLNDELTRQSRIDALTGLTNRRGFDEVLERAIYRCQRTSEPLSLVMVDIDHFKALNDAWGHPAGDQALRQMGGALAGLQMRKDDTAARYGGEEFALILPGSTAEGARRLAESLRTALLTNGIAHPTHGLITVSAGVSTQSGQNICPKRLMSEADNALYAAKREGRDRVVMHTLLVS